jgi:superfamily II DNA or RNA helicase
VLRDYQRRQLAEVAALLRDGLRRVLLQLPTGGGKTHEIAAIALCAHLVGLRVLILATRTRLVRQIHERLEGFGVPHGVIAAQMRGMQDRFQLVQVASADTLHRRCTGDGRMPMPSADVVIFDEAHLAVAPSRLALLEQFPAAVRIGLTATPARKSGQSLSRAFERLVLGPSILELIRAGTLVRPRIFNVPVVTAQELKALPKDAGNDYAQCALGDLLSRPRLVGDVVSNWLRIAADRSTIVFACNKAHGAQLMQEFCRAGVAAELLTDQDGEEEREAVIARLEAGETRIVVNCFLMAYGIDIPTVGCIVLARPTRSLVMYLQMVGRGLRTALGKEDCLLIDHGRVIESLGLPHIERAWSLDERRNVNTEASERQSVQSRTEQPRTCPECTHLWLVSEDGEACSECGWKPAPRARPVIIEDADLAELEDDPRAVTAQSPEVRQFFQEALHWSRMRNPQNWAQAPNKVRAAAWFRTREKFALPDTQGFPREVWTAEPVLCTESVAGWLLSQQIRFARRRRSA